MLDMAPANNFCFMSKQWFCQGNRDIACVATPDEWNVFGGNAFSQTWKSKLVQSYITPASENNFQLVDFDSFT